MRASMAQPQSRKFFSFMVTGELLNLGRESDHWRGVNLPGDYVRRETCHILCLESIIHIVQGCPTHDDVESQTP